MDRELTETQKQQRIHECHIVLNTLNPRIEALKGDLAGELDRERQATLQGRLNRRLKERDKVEGELADLKKESPAPVSHCSIGDFPRESLKELEEMHHGLLVQLMAVEEKIAIIEAEVPPVPPIHSDTNLWNGQWWEKYHLQFVQVFCAQSGKPFGTIKDQVLAYMTEHDLPVLCVLDVSLPKGDAWSVLRLRTPRRDQYVLRWSQHPYYHTGEYYCFTLRKIKNSQQF